MNTNEYLASGILEDYVLGTASEQERKEVECMTKIYPEIKSELTKLEDSIGKYISFYQKTPPAHLKDQIFAQMTFDESPKSETIVEKDEIIQMESSKTIPLWPRLSLAASVLLAALAAWLYVAKNNVSGEMAAVRTEMEQIKESSQQKEQLLALYGSADNKMVQLKGTENSPESDVRVFWNQTSNAVALMVNKLPETDTNHQYQLWTIVDGVPVDMGVLDPAFEGKIIAMKPAAGKVAAFAITLEKAGGSPTPTLEKMYVMGAV